ncbi:Thymocyte nuclear protein 1 [Trichoplax sp. H2]|nr:Thymocyte nuclear protein 1 [Trichoplax sp. H2]|eukprot:RDD46601.1 Thymocyte nuclear protein 1 [Trichoplax sp. H2]
MATITVAKVGSKRKAVSSGGSKTLKNSLGKKSSVTANKNSHITRWLLKSEPDSRFENGVDMKFSFDDLKSSPDQITQWDGVRNFQARNLMRDCMKVGHLGFFYHSNCKNPGIAGIVKVVKESYVDPTQFNREDPHFDSTSLRKSPKWFMVDVKYVRDLKRFISLSELKSYHEKHKTNDGPLKNMRLFTNRRLSVQPVTDEEYEFILSIEDQEPKKK